MNHLQSQFTTPNCRCFSLSMKRSPNAFTRWLKFHHRCTVWTCDFNSVSMMSLRTLNWNFERPTPCCEVLEASTRSHLYSQALPWLPDVFWCLSLRLWAWKEESTVQLFSEAIIPRLFWCWLLCCLMLLSFKRQNLKHWCWQAHSWQFQFLSLVFHFKRRC